jgi:hypothetical protein
LTQPTVSKDIEILQVQVDSTTQEPRRNKGKRKKVDTKILSDFHHSDYPTTEESEDDRPGGSRAHPLLLEVTRLYRRQENGKSIKRV